MYVPIRLIEKSIPKVPKSYFIGGETEALKRFRTKISNSPDYVKEFRKPSTISTNVESKPMEPTTTGLSPYISTGCISVRLVWNECMKIYSSIIRGVTDAVKVKDSKVGGKKICEKESNPNP